MYIKKLLGITATIGLCITGYFAYFIYTAMFQPNTNFNTNTAYVYIPTNATYNDVRSKLQPLLKNTDKFDALAKQKQYITYVKAGKYVLKKGMNNNDIINTLRSKNQPITVTFNNQETLEDLAGRIASQIEADSISLLKAFKDEAFLKTNNLNSENAINIYTPNSYEFFWNTSAEKFRAKMLTAYHTFWNKSRIQKAKTINLTPNEVITLASIVQKETVKVDERPRVAGVYLNRLKKKMPLQADPTVIYAIKKESGNFNQVIKRVLYKDLEINSKYNTYKHAGLPPGPIAMPDISAIEAVLNYEKHDYYYFVADVKRLGYHKFAKTLAQHNRNKNDYVKWINKQGINR